MFTFKLLSRSTTGLISKINICSLVAARNYSKSALRNSESQKILDNPETNHLNDFLISYAMKNRSVTPFTTLLEQLNSHANMRLPFILPYENRGRKTVTDKSDLTQGIVTVAHVLPLKDQVVLASGFAILDGGLIVTCAHTFYQAARYLSASEPDHKSQSFIITHEGEVIRVITVESHLVSSDLALLRLQEGRKITSLPVDPYPAPVSTQLLSYEFVTATLSSVESLSLIATGRFSLVLCHLVLSYFTFKKQIFLYFHNLWILLFRMVYNSSFLPCIFTEKSAVYDEGLHLSLLSDMSPITAPITKMVPNNDTPAKYIEKLISQEKTLFSRVWQGDRREGV